jgi:hypothetical protein
MQLAKKLSGFLSSSDSCWQYCWTAGSTGVLELESAWAGGTSAVVENNRDAKVLAPRRRIRELPIVL